MDDIDKMDRIYELLEEHPEGLYPYQIGGEDLLKDMRDDRILDVNITTRTWEIYKKSKPISVQPLEEPEECLSCRNGVYADFRVEGSYGSAPFCSECRYQIYE